MVLGVRVRTREGFIVDEETGLVIDDKPIDYEHPEYRVFSHEDMVRKAHYSPMEERYREEVNVVTVGEDLAIKAMGVRGVIIYRCLINAGMNANSVVDAIRKASTGVRGYGKVLKYVLALNRSISKAVKESLIRWNSRALGIIDLKYASERLGAPIIKGRVPQVIVEVNGFKVQITKSKVDITSRMYEHDRVIDVVLKLRKLLGVELSPPKAKVATSIIELPFELNLGLIVKVGGIHQGYRVKMMGDFWSALVFNETINMYVNLKDDLSRIELAMLQCLPKVCLAAKL